MQAMAASCCCAADQERVTWDICVATQDEGAPDELQPEDAEDAEAEEAAVEDVAPTVGTYQIGVSTDGQPLGLSFDTTKAGLMVRAVLAGPMKTHNVCSSDSTYVYQQDFIVKVNNVSDVEAMKAALAIHHELRLEMVHPKRLEVNIDSRTTALGLDLQAFDESSLALEILHIQDEGAAKDFNAHCPPECAIEAGDLIHSVNEVSGDLYKMYRELHAKRLLKLEILRVRGVSGHVRHVHHHVHRQEFDKEEALHVMHFEELERELTREPTAAE